MSQFTFNGINRPTSFIRVQVRVCYQIKKEKKKENFPFSEASEYWNFGWDRGSSSNHWSNRTEQQARQTGNPQHLSSTWTGALLCRRRRKSSVGFFWDVSQWFSFQPTCAVWAPFHGAFLLRSCKAGMCSRLVGREASPRVGCTCPKHSPGWPRAIWRKYWNFHANWSNASF